MPEHFHFLRKSGSLQYTFFSPVILLILLKTSNLKESFPMIIFFNIFKYKGV
jgi:hypothetical protein